MNTKERITVSKETIEDILSIIRSIDHVRRYQLIKRYCYGKVLDAACGNGYGSYLLSNNPDITEVVGVDISDKAIKYAQTEFQRPKVRYIQQPISELNESCDTFVSLETIEHLQDTEELVRVVNRCQPKILIVSFPEKKSTHFNEFHFHDFKKQDLINMFDSFACVRTIIESDVCILVFVRIDSSVPTHIFK